MKPRYFYWGFPMLSISGSLNRKIGRVSMTVVIGLLELSASLRYNYWAPGLRILRTQGADAYLKYMHDL